MIQITKGFRLAPATILLIALFCGPLSILAPETRNEAETRFFVTTQTGVLDGKALELVYYGPNNDGMDPSYLVSRLDWPFALLPYWGSRVDIETARGFRASFGLKAGLPGLRGSVEDYDYLNWDGVITHYSRHDDYVERALFLDLDSGWSFRVSPRLGIDLGIGLSLMSFKWTARDGYLQYPASGDYGNYQPWSPDNDKEYVYGTGMAYEQLHLIAKLVLGASYRLSEGCTARASFGFSPFAYCQDLDNHFLRSLDFYEWMYGGFSIEPGVEVGWVVKEGSELLLSLSWQGVSGLLGDSRAVDTATNSYSDYTDGAGAAYSALSFGLALKKQI